MTTTTPGREPRTIVDLKQPRCALTFGSAPCTASGSSRCFNTYSTCQDLANYDGSASITWRLTDSGNHDDLLGDFSDADNIVTPAIPCVTNVSTISAKINPGANRDGESPFGVTGRVTVRVKDIDWNDYVGDPYLSTRSGYQADRALPVKSGFWRLFNARNAFLNSMTLTIHDGYVGEAISAMRSRVYALENIDGPSFSGEATLTGVDPTKELQDQNRKYPPTSDLEVSSGISSSSNSVQVFGSESDILLTLGNDGLDHIKIGQEIITFTGYTDDGDNYYTLTGLSRGVLGTTADSHSEGDAVQRVANFDRIRPWDLLETILRFDNAIAADYIPKSEWDAECERYMPSSVFTRVLHEPRGVRTLAGEISQQGLLYVWWEPYESKIKLLTVRPPSDPVATLTDEANNLDGVTLTAAHTERITRVVVRYLEKDPFEGDEASNFARAFVSVDTDTEGSGVTPVIKEIFARWITTRSQAVSLAVKLLLRYKATPRFLKLRLDAKDREIQIGDLADVFTRYLVDADGQPITERWQAISASEIDPGHTYVLDLQSYTFVGRFATYMPDDAPDYDSATEEERANGAWYAGDDGLVSGDEGYKYQ